MTHRTFGILSILGAAVLAAAPAAAQSTPPTPSATDVIHRACRAAGGVRAFNALGTLQVEIHSQEVTSDGHTTQNARRVTFQAPGPIPGRLEIGGVVVAGDDGEGGWALVQGHPDTRPTTTYMVRRSIQTALFPVLLPFSLHWEGVTVSKVAAGKVDGKPTWELTLTFPLSFFDNPQIGTTWKIDVDRATYAVVRAQSPFVDLGKGIKSDGMRFSWGKRTRVEGISLPTEQTINGIDLYGRENAHNREDSIIYRTPTVKDVSKLYANPIPLDQRPKPPKVEPPTGLNEPEHPGGGR